MESHYQLTDDAFAAQFADCTIDPELFTHEAHLRLAWILLSENELSEAIDLIRHQLIAFTTKVGASDKYHDTLTVAAVYIVRHFKQKSQAVEFRAFLTEFSGLKTHFKDLVGSHYSSEILDSQDSRSQYIGPDRLPFM